MRRSLFAVPLVVCVVAAHAADSTRLGIGVEASSGRYGSATTTRVHSVPLTASATRGAWTVKASLPLLRVQGDASVIPGVGPVTNLNPLGRGRTGLPILEPQPGEPAAGEQGTATGLGDLRLSTTYLVAGESAGVGLTANAKLATADEDKGLGTGANDYGAAVDAYRHVGTATLFGGVGYTRLGTSRHINVESAANANAGVSLAAGRGRVGAQYDWREPVTRGAEARRDATGFYARPVGKRSELQVFASKGMSDGSPDWSAGLGVSVGF